MRPAERFIGVDFSGGSKPWRSKVRSSTVWLATVCALRKHLVLQDLHPVQELSGSGDGFTKLVNWLGEGKFPAAAIDAPFSIPAVHLPDGEHGSWYARWVGCRLATVVHFRRGSNWSLWQIRRLQ